MGEVVRDVAGLGFLLDGDLAVVIGQGRHFRLPRAGGLDPGFPSPRDQRACSTVGFVTPAAPAAYRFA